VAGEEKLLEALEYLKLDCGQVKVRKSPLPMPSFMRPKAQRRLVNKMEMFNTYVLKKDCSTLLEASRCYEVLSTLDSVRESAVAQERRLNAVYLAEAAYDANKDGGPPSELARAYVVAAEFYAGQIDVKVCIEYIQSSGTACWVVLLLIRSRSFAWLAVGVACHMK
jgi:hypothetical protein